MAVFCKEIPGKIKGGWDIGEKLKKSQEARVRNKKFASLSRLRGFEGRALKVLPLTLLQARKARLQPYNNQKNQDAIPKPNPIP